MTGKSAKVFAWNQLPGSIRSFVFAYLACVAVEIVNGFRQFEVLRANLWDIFETVEVLDDSWVYGVILLRVALFLAVLAWVLLRYSLVGRLLIGAHFLGFAYQSPTAIQLIAEGNVKPILFLLAGFCSAIAVFCLVLKPSRDWFAQKGRTLEDDLQSFS